MMPRRWSAVDSVMPDRKLRTLDIGILQGEYNIENMEVARLSARTVARKRRGEEI